MATGALSFPEPLYFTGISPDRREEFFSETCGTEGSNLPHKITVLPVGLAF
jgi:hypothetical protein